MKFLLILLLSIFLMAEVAWAIPAFDNADATSGEGVDSVFGSFTTSGSDRFMIPCAFLFNDGEDLTDFTYNGVSSTPVASVISPGTINSYMRRLTNPAADTNDYEFIFPSVQDYFTVAIMSFTGVHQTTPVGTFASQGSAGAEESASVNVSSATDDLVVDCFGLQTTGHTLGTTQTSRWTHTDVIPYSYSGSTKTGAATVTMSRTWGDGSDSQYFGLIAVPLKPAAAAVTRRRMIVFQ